MFDYRYPTPTGRLSWGGSKEASHARVAALAGLEPHAALRVGVPQVAFSKAAPDLAFHLHRLTQLLGPNIEPLASCSRDGSQLGFAKNEHTRQN